MRNFLTIVLSPIILKVLWVISQTFRHGSLDKEKNEIIRRANYLVSKVRDPEQLFNEMPNWFGPQFQGEWALYTCSMTTIALANIANLYPEKRDMAIKHIERIIDITLSSKIREYDRERWDEDPLESLDGNKSHMSYLSHLAWMIGRFKQIGGSNKYDSLYHLVCDALHRRMLQSPYLNLPTYPPECIYVPDMLVVIVALKEYADLYDGRYLQTIHKWMRKAKTEWIDPKTGLLASRLSEYGDVVGDVRGSYSALNCFYLSLVDKEFAQKQYEIFKRIFKQTMPFTGIKEYQEETPMFGMDPDAGPILFKMSPSGTAFAVGCATTCGDKKFRKQLLRTAEIAGSTIRWKDKSHYLLANWALVGEAVMLAGRTSHGETMTEK